MDKLPISCGTFTRSRVSRSRILNSSGVRKIPPSYDNTRLTVEFLEDGEMYHGHLYILLLEKIDWWDDELEWDLLQAAGRLTKGEGMIDDFLYYYHMYRSRWKKE